jgi:peptidoglycan-associated lipoprotein
VSRRREGARQTPSSDLAYGEGESREGDNGRPKESDVTIILALIIAVATTGCAKRVVPTASSTPTPAGGADRPVGAGQGAAQGAPTLGTPGVANTPGAPGQPGTASSDRSPTAGTSRPPVNDFTAIGDLVDVYFELDHYTIRPADAAVLDSNARWLRSNRSLVLIEGHCDERGTSEYNLALGERRAQSTMNYLVSQGIAASRITIVSYGKERPQCTEHTEGCWRKNRRAHFLVKPQ